MRRYLLVTALLLLAAAFPACAGDFFYRNDEVPIVFLGDSITEQRLYTTFIEHFVTTRYPAWKVQFRNIGWGGDTAHLSQRQGFENGLKRDILALNPKAITIDFGMNDARGGDAALPRYIEHSTKLAQRLKAAGARVALLSPSPEERYEGGQPGGSNYNHMLAKFTQALKAIAEKEEVRFVDQYTPFIQVIESGRNAGVLGAAGAPRLIPDGVHPNFAGQLVMAASILKGLDAPAVVSTAEIDAAAKKVGAVDGCTVKLIDAAGAELAFERSDNALPWYIHPDAEFALKIPGFTPLNDLSRYDLKVKGLKADNYDLLIDDKKAGTYSRTGLEAGVNLSLATGPITEQSARVFHTIFEKNNLYFTRWRQVQIFIFPDWANGPEIETKRQAEMARIDKLIAQKELEIETHRRPLPHVFKLVPAK